MVKAIVIKNNDNEVIYVAQVCELTPTEYCKLEKQAKENAQREETIKLNESERIDNLKLDITLLEEKVKSILGESEDQEE